MLCAVRSVLGRPSRCRSGNRLHGQSYARLSAGSRPVVLSSMITMYVWPCRVQTPMPSSRVPTVPCITGNWVRTDRMPVPRRAESALTAKVVRSVRAGTRPVSIASWKQRSVARPMTSADSPRREEDARPNRGRKGVAPRRISPMNLGGGSATGTGYNTTRHRVHRVIPDCFRGSVMASAANSAAAARSSDDGAAMAALPDGEGGSRDENADEVAKHGLHARCPYCDRGP